MKYMHSEWRDRLYHWLETLKKDLYRPILTLKAEGFVTADELDLSEAAAGPFRPMAAGEKWGMEYEYLWLRSSFILPEEARGRRIAMDLCAGGETTVFLNGRAFGTYRAGWVDVKHHFACDNFLPPSIMPGDRVDLMLEAYAGHFYPESQTLGGCSTGPVIPGDYADPLAGRPRAVLGDMTVGIWNEDAYQLYLDMHTLMLLMDQADPESLRAARLADALEKATLEMDFEQPPAGRELSCRLARESLKAALAAVNGTTAPQFYAVGNAHLDLAWLWPMAETRRKTARTFAAQLRLMEEYPFYRYLQSQPAAYEMCRKKYPELYARILRAAKNGQWIPEGAAWVEPDTNMPSGEALVRQLLYGRRYFREEFGVDSVILWLPDSFGYSAALPQILKGFGVRYLVTQKIFWSYNEGEKFPWHYFAWEGNDGSRVTAFLPTSYTYRTDPKEIISAWKGRTQKRDLEAFLLPFGYGDGGGGPTRDHIEYLKREKDLEGMPRVKMASPVDFFEEMDRMGGPKHTWTGELYFTAHRGTYTSQAEIKKGNRRCETALREAEMWCALSAARGAAYPYGQLEAAWKKLLLNQFHDILPGSSIGKVYEKARSDHRRILEEAGSLCAKALGAMTDGDGVTVFNSLSFERTCLVPLDERFAAGAADTKGQRVPSERICGRIHALVALPPCGCVSLVPSPGSCPFTPARAVRTQDGVLMDNGILRVLVSPLGEVISLALLSSGREFARAPMNRLRLYKDVPRKFDAWDIDSNYVLQPVPLPETAEIEILSSGGLCASAEVSRTVGNSRIRQTLVLAAGSRRLEFRTHADWHETHRLLKADFPIAVHAEDGLNEIQYGYVSRPAHDSRPWDSDRFEVCNHRWSALCDQGHGAAVLNDCKYGVSMRADTLSLTLLRAPACPDPDADRGEHDFTYAITVWEGSFLDSPVVREAADLNTPPPAASGTAAPFSTFSTDRENILVDAVKCAEDGSGDVILRLYECKKADTACRLRANVPHVRALACDMEENSLEPLEEDENGILLRFRAFEVRTVRLKMRE